MTTQRLLLLIASVMLLLPSCKKESVKGIDEPKISTNLTTNISVKGVTGYAATLAENEIHQIDVFSFVKLPDGANYTFEEQSSALISSEQTTFTISRAGSLARILYFVANGTSNIPYLSTINQTKPTLVQFESMAIVKNSHPLQTPMTLVAKAELPNPLPVTSLNVELAHTSACLVINNKYVGFTVDSLVLRDAVSGAFLFNVNTPNTTQAQRVNINYGVQNTIYLYQTDASTLAVYGKYNGIRTVFDIALNNIKSGTRYNITFRSINDNTVNFASNLMWDVALWNGGEIIDSTPDWK